VWNMFKNLLKVTKPPGRYRSEFGLALCLCLAASACSAPEAQQDDPPIAVSPIQPKDIEGGAFNASLDQAAVYAWNQFISLNWSAVEPTGELDTRGVARSEGSMGQAGPRVWETYRAKTEVFPGIGNPHGFTAGAEADYGYDDPPKYRYDPSAVGEYPGLEAGQVPACFESQSGQTPPLVELSESHEVGPERLYSGMAPGGAAASAGNQQRILYAVKVNRNFYRYVVSNGWLNGGNPGSSIPAIATQKYISKWGQSPPVGSSERVSFPDETVQIKTAWRRLSGPEKKSHRFHTAWARAYQDQDPTRTYHGQIGNPKHPCFVDSEWGLIAMHVKTKTASAPYYIWATFEHVDTLTDREGHPVEDESGRLIRNANLQPTEPHITSRNATATVPATPDTIQRLSPLQADAEPGKRMYYFNLSDTPTTQGRIAVNRRDHEIPQPVIAANEAAHQSLRRFMDEDDQASEKIPSNLMNYKLVGIQWKPANKPVAGQDLQDMPDENNEVLRYHLIYYLANISLETSYRLQHYSGTVQPRLAPPYQDLDVQDLLTDFDTQGRPVKNVAYAGMKPDGEHTGFNMGGCMGCHGQMQIKGYDFNFIFRRGRINAPETSASLRLPLADMVHGEQHHD
jgi:hypothetical protein